LDPLTGLIVLALAFEIPACLIAVVYILRVQWPVRGQAPFLDRLVKRDVRVALSGLVIGSVIVYNLLRLAGFNLSPIPSPWSSVLIGCALIVLLWGPIDDALATWRERRV